MPASTCFSYSPDVPPGIRDRDAVQRAARDLRRSARRDLWLFQLPA